MKKLTMLCLSGLVAVAVSGCQSESTVSNVISADSYTKNVVGYQKQGAAVSLVNSKVSLANAGVQYSIDLAINSKYNSGEMEVTVTSSEGLNIISGTTAIKETLIKGEMTFPFEVTAEEDGRYYLYAAVKTQSNGKTSARALTLIVQVGEQEKTSKGTPAKTKKGKQVENADETTFGEPVLSPASEEIIQ